MPLLARAFIAVVFSCVIFTSCQTESQPIAGTTTIRADPPKTTLISRARVFENDRLVATLRTYRFEDRPERSFIRVSNLREDVVGYVTDDGRAFRFTAHGGENLVANSNDLRKNVAAIMGVPLSTYEIKDDLTP